MKDNEEKINRIKKIITIVAILVLIACVVYIVLYFWEEYNSDKSFEELRRKKNITPTVTAIPTLTETPVPTLSATPVASMTGTPVPSDATPTPTLSPTPTPSPTPTEAVMLPGYEALYEQNNDFAGWIKIEGTTYIDYPVMHIPGEKVKNGQDYFYTYRGFDKKIPAAAYKPGCIFIDGRCSVYPERSDILLIYGHNMIRGTMFAELHKYKQESFYRQHPYVQFDTLYSEDTYIICYVYKVQVGEKYPNAFKFLNYVDFKDKATFDYYIESTKALQLYNTGVDVEYGDELIALVTCTKDTELKDGRIVILAKKIKKD